MALVDIINNDIKTAMLAKDKDKLEALRAVKAALLIAGTSGEGVNEDTEVKLLQKLVKQRKEAAEIYQKNGKNDLADNELKQVSYIEPYLPKQMSLDEIKTQITAIIASVNANGMKDMGKVMGIASKQLAGKADNKAVSEIVKQLLS